LNVQAWHQVSRATDDKVERSIPTNDRPIPLESKQASSDKHVAKALLSQQEKTRNNNLINVHL